MAQDLTSVYDYDAIQSVIIDGQYMVKIPKFYIKAGYPGETSQNAGKRTIWITSKPRDDFHIYPAFVRNNKVMDCFYYGAYEASMEGYPNGDHWDSTGKQRVLTGLKACSLPNVHVWNYIFNEEAQTACNARNTGTGEQAGWHLQNVYEVWAIAMLMIVEYGRTDFVNAIGTGNCLNKWTTSKNVYGDDYTVNTGSSTAAWRGIHELWGNCWEHYTGITTDAAGKLSILNHKMDGTLVATGIGEPSGGTKSTSNSRTRTDGWPITLHDESGTGYDIKDIFCPATESTQTYTQSNTLGSIHDYSWWMPKDMYGTSSNAGYRPQTAGYCHGSFAYSSSVCGPLLFSVINGYANADIGFRLAKYGEATDEVAFED